MYLKTLCASKRTLSSMHINFNAVKCISHMNSMYKFKDIRRIFTIVRACTDGRTQRQTDKQIECINFSTLLEQNEQISFILHL